MSSFEEVLARFPSKRALVIGDLMLDRFVYGNVNRISPEAPAPVLNAGKSEEALGGAANVARNIVALGAACEIIGVLGQDGPAQILAGMLESAGAVSSCIVDPGRHTSVKMRFVANLHNTHLLRADWEHTSPLSEEYECRLLEAFDAAITKADAVILSDYQKGVLTPRVLAHVIAGARRLGTPVVVDPKGSDASKYHGVTAMTPNISEVRQFLGTTLSSDDESLLAAGRALIELTGSQAILITRSEQGVLVAERGGPASFFPATAIRVADVSGAGDTLAGSFALALAAGASFRNAAQLANAAAGIAVAKKGTSVTSLAELRDVLLSRPHFGPDTKIFGSRSELSRQVSEWKSAGLTVGFTNGCYDLLHPGHIHLLKGARERCDRLIVGLNSDASVKRLKGPGRPIQGESARAAVMAAIGFVDAVSIFDEDTPLELIEAIVPDVLVKGADYALNQVVGREAVEKAGGRVALVDLLAENSTTGIVKRISAANASKRAAADASVHPSVQIRLGRRAGRLLTGRRRPALFLDRDGVIIEDTGYVGRVEDVKLLSGVAKAIRLANIENIPVVVVSNQSGVGRGYFGWSEVISVDDTLSVALANDGAFIDLTIYAGAAPGDDDEALSFRKPSPGMLVLASQILSLNLPESIMVGDRPGDLKAAASAGLRAGCLAAVKWPEGSIATFEEEFPGFGIRLEADAASAINAAISWLAEGEPWNGLAGGGAMPVPAGANGGVP